MNAGCGTERRRKTAVKAGYGRLSLPAVDDHVGGDVIRSEPPGTDPPTRATVLLDTVETRTDAAAHARA